MMRSGSLCVLGLDPGGSTGWCTWQTDIIVLGEGKLEASAGKYTQGQLGPDEHHLALWDLLGHMHAANYVIVCESFEYRQDQRPNVSLVSKEYIGITELYHQDRNRTLPDEAKVQLYRQTAATGKGFWYPKVKGKKDTWDGSKLKAVGLYHPTTDGRHINDATAHLLHWLTYGPLQRTDLLMKLRDI